MCVCCLTQYSLYSLYAIVVVVCPVLSAAPVIQCIFYWCTIMFCYCCLTQLSLCSLSQCCCFASALFSAQLTLLLTRYANFVYLGFRRSLAYLHLSAASPPSSVAIGGNCVCVLFSLVCNLYRLLVASLTAGLNNVPITENSPWCLVKAREGTSPVTVVTSVPWERERDITEVAVLAARPAKRRSVSDSDVIVACTAFYTASQLVSICMRSRQLASHLTGVSQ